jgi:hypothetical protein
VRFRRRWQPRKGPSEPDSSPELTLFALALSPLSLCSLALVQGCCRQEADGQCPAA